MRMVPFTLRLRSFRQSDDNGLGEGSNCGADDEEIVGDGLMMVLMMTV